MLLNTWQLPRPSVILSITGAAAGTVDLNEVQRNVFTAGIGSVIRDTRAWVVTGGTNGGVMEMVGKSMAQFDFDESENVCLGVATWGIVKHHEALEKQIGHIYHYSEASREEAAGIRRVGKEVGPRAELEPHHTHFLFADAGPEATGQFGKEIDLRVQLESFLTTRAGQSSSGTDVDEHHSSAMVLVVVAGGAGTLQTVLSVLEASRPVVVLVNSGGAAREIYEYVKHGTLPELDPKDGKNLVRKRYYVEEKAPIQMPQIKELGGRQHGLYNSELLTFFGTSDLAPDKTGVVQYEQRFNDFLLKAIFTNCQARIEALIHGIYWGLVPVVESEITQMIVSAQKGTDPEGVRTIISQVDHAFYVALRTSAANRDNESYLASLDTLLNFDVRPTPRALSALFRETRLARYPSAVPIDALATHARLDGSPLRRQKSSFWGMDSDKLAHKLAPDQFCFHVLENLVTQSGYRDFLRARHDVAMEVTAPDAPFQPCFCALGSPASLCFAHVRVRRLAPL